jgi:putative hydrolase of the HAD superfamily
MALPLNKQSVFVTDLDDTLCYEADFVFSGLKAAALITGDARAETEFYLRQGFALGHPPFDYLFRIKPGFVSLKDVMLNTYREHHPTLHLRKGAREMLDYARANAKAVILISDGRSNSQRNKLKALGIENFFDAVFISGETGFGKKMPASYDVIERDFPAEKYYFVGDNPAKDFVIPLQRGWQCYGLLNDGRHIHPQTPELLKQAAGVTFARHLYDLVFPG